MISSSNALRRESLWMARDIRSIVALRLSVQQRNLLIRIRHSADKTPGRSAGRCWAAIRSSVYSDGYGPSAWRRAGHCMAAAAQPKKGSQAPLRIAGALKKEPDEPHIQRCKSCRLGRLIARLRPGRPGSRRSGAPRAWRRCRRAAAVAGACLLPRYGLRS